MSPRSLMPRAWESVVRTEIVAKEPPGHIASLSNARIRLKLAD